MVQGRSEAAARLRSIAGSVLAALTVMSTPAWAADCKMQPTTLPVLVVQNRVVAVLKINGLDVPMMVGSSAQYSVLSPKIAAALKLPLTMMPFGQHLSGNGENLESQTTVVDRLTLGGLELRNVNFVVTDVRPGLELQGVIGRDILAAGDTEYDLARGVVRLVFPLGDCKKVSLAYWAGDAPVIEVPMAPLRDDRDTMIRLPVSINDTPAVAMLSTGSQTSTLSRSTARKAGIPESRLQVTEPAGRSRQWLTDVDSFQLGGERITHQRLEVEDAGRDGDYGMSLGVDYMLAHRIYVSYLQRKVYATWNGGDVFAAREGASENRFDARFAAPPPARQEDVLALASRAALDYELRRYPAALEGMNRAIALKSDVANQFLTRARIHAALGDAQAALDDADEALRLDPQLDDAIMEQARAHTRLNRRDDALAALAQLDARLSRDADQRFRMAVIYRGLDRVPEAHRQWELWMDTHRRDVNYGNAYNDRCFMRTVRNLELAIAVQDCERAVAIDATSSNFQDSLAWTRLLMGDLPRARAAFDAALRLKPGFAWALYGRSLVWKQQGDAERARQDLEAARESDANIDQQVRESGLPTHDSAR